MKKKYSYSNRNKIFKGLFLWWKDLNQSIIKSIWFSLLIQYVRTVFIITFKKGCFPYVLGLFDSGSIIRYMETIHIYSLKKNFWGENYVISYHKNPVKFNLAL